MIEDSDESSTEILLSASPAMVAEDAGATAVTVTATLNHASREVAANRHGVGCRERRRPTSRSRSRLAR